MAAGTDTTDSRNKLSQSLPSGSMVGFRTLYRAAYTWTGYVIAEGDLPLSIIVGSSASCHADQRSPASQYGSLC